MIRTSTRALLALLATIAALALGAAPASAAADTTTLTASADRTRIATGQSVTISGTLTRNTAEGARPVASATIGIAYCPTPDFCGEFVARPVTDTAGRYRASVSPIRSGSYRADFLPTDATLGRASATTAPITVVQTASIPAFTATRGADGTISAKGTIAFARFTPPSIPVEIQYFSTKTWRWTTATTAVASWNGSGFAFAATTDRPGWGLWRAHYAGVPDQFTPATSDLVLVR
ncbi:hypothetical protein [Amycolatopsis samaneae]|uniref:Carboxypeptidase regulatory-like domain-containing protein n=1 Tax=Amycolatopsis samaneae TaxID=664691 RepID=A0ABW5G6N1_9PSEU